MFPNKPMLVAAIAILVLPLLAGPASSQTQPGETIEGSDLVVLRITPSASTAGKAQVVTITIKNQGNEVFQSTNGWEIKYGWNNVSTGCAKIYPDVAQQESSLRCTIKFTPGDTSTSSMMRIDVGESKEATFTWTPSENLVVPNAGNGLGRMLARIQPWGCDTGTPGGIIGGGGPTDCTSGPDNHPQNNLGDFSYFVRRAGVHAVPIRDLPKNEQAVSVNSAWYSNEITTDCPKTTPVTVGCKPQPDSTVLAAFRVKNYGNDQDTFVGSIVDGGGPNSLTARSYTFNFSPRFVTLEPYQEKEVILSIYVPASELAGKPVNVGSITQTVRWTSQTDDRKTTDDPPDPPCGENPPPELCQDPSFPSFLIGIKHGLNASTNESRRIAYVGDEVRINITLNNTGNAVDTYSFKVNNETAQINASWSPYVPNNVTVKPWATEKRTENVTITLKPPANATKGPHPFDLAIQSEADTEGKTLHILNLVADLQQNFKITGGEVNTRADVLPAQKATYVFNLKNDGNGPDNVSLRLDAPNLPFGWQTQLTPSPVFVPAFSTVPIYLNVTPPPNTLENTAQTFYVNATSQGPIEKSPEQRTNATYVGHLVVLSGPNLEVNAPVKSAFVDPGNSTDFDLVVRNVGNKRSNFTISVERQQDQLAWTADYSPNYLFLEPLQSGNVKVSLRAPNQGIVGETTKVFVRVRAAADAAVYNETTLEGQVSGPDLFVSSVLLNSTTPYTGDPVELNVVLGNSGNKAPSTNATLKVYFVQGGIPRLIAEKEYTTQEMPGGRRLSERILWDTTGIEGAGLVIAKFDENDDVREIDDSPASNEGSRPLTIRTYDLNLVPATGLSGLPGEHLSYSEQPHVFLAEYRGNQPTEPVEIIIESEHGWLAPTTAQRISIALPKGSAVPILVDIDIPGNPGVAKDTLRVTIVPQLRPDATLSATTITTVVDTQKPVIGAVSAAPGIVKLGEPVTISAKVTDATGLSSVRAFVVTPANETQSVLLEPAGDDVWTRTQPFLFAGSYRLYVEAIDNAQPQNANTSRDTVITFAVMPGSAPKITLADGQPSTVRTGALVRLNITDPLGVSKATYAIKGITYDLPKPYSIDTSSFTNGTYDVNVTAENIYGVATTERFTLTIDNTPPGIRSITINPSTPRANQDVTLRIETDSKVDVVEVLIKKDGQIVGTREATKKGSGVFELLFNPGEGQYTIDVTAKDGAGNVKLAESAVQFSARPGSPFDIPGAGLVGAAVALALAAVVLRRRS